jgi:hypothetical protein
MSHMFLLRNIEDGTSTTTRWDGRVEVVQCGLGELGGSDSEDEADGVEEVPTEEQVVESVEADSDIESSDATNESHSIV